MKITQYLAGILAAALALFSCTPETPPVTASDVFSRFGGEEIVPATAEWDGEKRGAITYQALVYSFADGDGDGIGDIAGLKSRLGYLDGLGVSAVWLSPIHPSTSYHGYDVEDYTAVNPEFGTDSDLKAFIEDAHSRGIKVYLDYVLNHTSAAHPWFLDAKTSSSSQYLDFYAFSDDPQADIAAGLIPQIATQGASGYDSGQWFPTGFGTGAEGRLKFVLDWSTPSAPTVTVSRTDEPADPLNTDTSIGGKYLHFGEDVVRRFYETEDGIYELTLDFSSDWGFLIRTSTSSWAQGTKYGAADDKTVIKFDVPFRLVSNQTANPVDIRFSEPEFFHSHFWTSTFADLNYGPASEAERSGAFAALTEAADKWVEMGVDGFRLDAVKHIYHNQDSDENPVFLKKFYDRMNDTWHRTGGQGDFYMVGEMLDGSSKAAPYYKGLPALFEFDFWYRLSWALQNGTGCYFAKDIMSYRDAYRTVRPDYIAAVKLSNHDENRTGSELGGDVDKMKVAAAVLLTASGEPYIYQGEELGYTGTKDNGDEYVRTPVMWDRSGAEIAAGALDGKVDMAMLVPGISVEAQEKDGNSLLNVYRTFSMLRNTYPALAHGQMERHPVYNDTNDGIPSVAAWYMTDGEDRMLVLHNFAGRNVTLSLDDDLSRPVALLGRAAVKASGGGYQLLLDGLSSVVFEL